MLGLEGAATHLTCFHVFAARDPGGLQVLLHQISTNINTCVCYARHRYRSDVEAAIREATGLSRIVWRPAWRILAEEGLTPPPEEQQQQQEGAKAGAEEESEAEQAERVEVREAGLRYWASPMVSCRAAAEEESLHWSPVLCCT